MVDLKKVDIDNFKNNKILKQVKNLVDDEKTRKEAVKLLNKVDKNFTKIKKGEVLESGEFYNGNIDILIDEIEKKIDKTKEGDKKEYFIDFRILVCNLFNYSYFTEKEIENGECEEVYYFTFTKENIKYGTGASEFFLKWLKYVENKRKELLDNLENCVFTYEEAKTVEEQQELLEMEIKEIETELENQVKSAYGLDKEEEQAIIEYYYKYDEIYYNNI